MTSEREIQDQFAAWLTERQIPFIRSRMDRRATIQTGWPDFTILWMRRNIMIECKAVGGKLSQRQVRRIEYLRRSGNVVEIARNLSECVDAVQNVLCEGKPAVIAYSACNYPLEGCFKELKRAVAAVPGNGTEQLKRGGWCESQGVPHEFDVCTGPLGDSRIGKLICNFCGELEEDLSGDTETAKLSNNLAGNSEAEARRAPPAQSFYIGNWNGTDYVFAPDLKGAYRMIRQASAIDVFNLPQLKAQPPSIP